MTRNFLRRQWREDCPMTWDWSKKNERGIPKVLAHRGRRMSYRQWLAVKR